MDDTRIELLKQLRESNKEIDLEMLYSTIENNYDYITNEFLK